MFLLVGLILIRFLYCSIKEFIYSLICYSCTFSRVVTVNNTFTFNFCGTLRWGGDDLVDCPFTDCYGLQPLLHLVNLNESITVLTFYRVE